MRSRGLMICSVAVAMAVASIVCWWSLVLPSPRTSYSEQQLGVMRWLALHGDRSANKRLFFHSAVVAGSPDEAERWLLLGARRGDP